MSSSSRTKKFLYNSLSTGIYQVVVMIVGFITPRVMLACYGSEINGLVSSITQFITYFNLVEAGISGAAVYALYRPLAEDDHREINGIVSAARIFYIQAGFIFVALVAGMALIYPMFVKTPELAPVFVGMLVVMLGGKGFFEFFTMAKYRSLLTADQKTYVISLASIVYALINLVVIVVLSYMKVNIVIVYAVALTSFLARTVILAIYVRRNYKYINYKERPNKQALDKRWDALFLQVLQTVQIGAPAVLATIFTNLKTVSVFTVFNMVLTGINGVLSIFVSGLPASFGDVLARNEVKTLQKAYKDFEFSYMSLITIIYAVAFIMIMPFIRLYTVGINDTNYDIPLLGFLFVLNGLLYNMKTPQGMLVISAGLYKETRLQTSIQGAILVVGGIIGGYFWGLAGIMAASCLSNFYRVIDLMIYIPHNVTKLPVHVTLLRYIRMIFILLIICVPCVFIRFDISNYLMWAVYAVAACVYSTVIVVVFGLVFDRKQMFYVFGRFKGMLKRGG